MSTLGNNEIYEYVRGDSIDPEGIALPEGSTIPASGVLYQGSNLDVAVSARLPDAANYAYIRSFSGQNTSFYVRGASNDLDGGAGIFRVKAGDTTSADNGGTILVDAIGRRWFREFNGAVNVKWFGADNSGNSVCKTQILAAHSAGKHVFYPSGIYNLGNLAQNLSVQEIAVDFTGMGTIIMETDSDVTFRATMTTGGITYAFKFDGNSHSKIGNCRFEGFGYDPNLTWCGVSAFLLNGGNWGDITFGDIYVTNMVSGITVTGGDTNTRIRGIR
jgi:hypothetical protein